MRSREDETYISLVNNQPVMTAESIQFEIATSLGRIADMLAEMNGYVIDYDERRIKQKKDVIDRQTAIEALKNLSVELDAETVQRCIEAVSNLPSAE